MALPTNRSFAKPLTSAATGFAQARPTTGLDLEALEQALLVLDTGSFRKAAELTGVNTSAVSRRIRALEDMLGVSLFQRRTQGAQPTRAGLRLLGKSRRVIDELCVIMRAARLAGEGAEGVLCIGVVASFAGGGARDLLMTFGDAHRGVELYIAEGSSRDHISAVQGLRMDAAFVVGEPPRLGCVVETLWVDPIMVALPRSHRLADALKIDWSELQSERFLVSRMDPGPEIQDYIVQHLAMLGHHPIVQPRNVGRDGLMGLIGLGQGISLVSGAEAEVTYPGVVFRPLDDDELPYAIVWSEQNDNPLLRRFMSLARRWSKDRRSLDLTPGGALGQTHDPSP